MVEPISRKPLKIALGHKARVGKDTFAEYLAGRGPLLQLSFASNLYGVTRVIQEYLNKPVVKDPGLLQMIGTFFREHYGEDIWTNLVSVQLHEWYEKRGNVGSVIITDMRFPNEMKFLKDEGFVTIKITRENRPIDRDPNHISETALDDAEFDYTIGNDGTTEEFYAKIDLLIEEINSSR